MKKTLGVAAAAALAATPIMGVFAADSLNPIVDTVKVTIDSACSLSGTAGSFSETMTNSQLKSDFGSTTLTIKCNDAGGWHLQAIGFTNDTDGNNVMDAAGSGTDIVSGPATSGDNSNWAFKVAGDHAISGFTTFTTVPTTLTDVASDSAETDMTDGTTITTHYQVWISSTQEADSYTGKVKYVLSHPAS